jgi:hypothetical protein
VSGKGLLALAGYPFPQGFFPNNEPCAGFELSSRLFCVSFSLTVRTATPDPTVKYLNCGGVCWNLHRIKCHRNIYIHWTHVNVLFFLLHYNCKNIFFRKKLSERYVEVFCIILTNLCCFKMKNYFTKQDSDPIPTAC